MTAAQWDAEAWTVRWYGAFDGDALVGVMGLERWGPVALLRTPTSCPPTSAKARPAQQPWRPPSAFGRPCARARITGLRFNCGRPNDQACHCSTT